MDASRSDPTQSACDGRARLIGDKIPKQSTQRAERRREARCWQMTLLISVGRRRRSLDLHTGNKQKL